VESWSFVLGTVTDEACPARDHRSRVGLAAQGRSGRSGEIDRGPEPVDGRGCAIEAQDIRVDRVPGLGPVEARPRLAGIRGRSQRKGQALAAELGTDHFDPRPDEPNLVLHAGDDPALEPGERRGTPVGSVRAAVAPCRRQAANVPLGAVVVRRHRRVVQEGEQLVTVLVQPLPDPHAVGMTRSGLAHPFVEAIDDPLVGLVELRGAELVSILAQLDGIAEQVDERLNERPHRLPGEFLAQLGQLAEQVDQAPLLGAIQAVVRRVEVADQAAGERFSQDPDEDIATTMAVDEEQRQPGISEAPSPGGLAVDPPAGLVPWTTGD
jgi:hypothetical protein